MPKRCFYGISDDFLFLRSSVPERKAVCDRPHHEWSKPSPTAGKPGRMPYLSARINSSQQIRHTSLLLVCPVSRFRHGLLSFFGVFFLSRISLVIFLNMPLPTFTSIFAPFSWYASGHSRSGRKGNSGILRKSKVKPPVSAKNLQPCG